MVLQILKLLNGEESIEMWVKPHRVYGDEQEEGENRDVNEFDDEVYQNSSAKKSHLALLDVEDDFTSFCSGERSRNSPSCTLQDLLSGRFMQEVV